MGSLVFALLILVPAHDASADQADPHDRSRHHRRDRHRFPPGRAQCRALEPKMAEFEIDQLIHEYEAWVHVGSATKPRAQALTVDIRGTRMGFG
jgi:hypothetical protein